MPRKIETEEWSWSVKGKEHTSWIRDYQGWTEGSIATEWGIVSVYSQGDDRFSHSTRMDIVHDGRCIARNIYGKRYSKRGLVTLAKRFAKEITQGTQHKANCDT
jgi:hypothetical protein